MPYRRKRVEVKNGPYSISSKDNLALPTSESTVVRSRQLKVESMLSEESFDPTRQEQMQEETSVINLKQPSLGLIKGKLMSQALGLTLKSRLADISEFRIRFNKLRFIKMLTYHILFFIIGPFVCLPMTIIDSWYISLNMGFNPFSKQRFIFILQSLQWGTCVYFFVVWILKLFFSRGYLVPGI